MADLLALSSDVIDGRLALEQAGPLNRINHQLSEINDRLAVVEVFSHCIVFRTDDGLVTFDTSNEQSGTRCVEAIRSWDRSAFHSIEFTHGHIDHVGDTAFQLRHARGETSLMAKGFFGSTANESKARLTHD